MCFMSAVFDQYQPFIPVPVEPWRVPNVPGRIVAPPYSNEELRELIDSLRKALAAAETFDRLTGQPDCEDPEKAKLLDRVAELERRLDALEAV